MATAYGRASGRRGYLARQGEIGLLRSLLARHREVFPPPPEGPGDDAAVLGRSLWTTDALVEGTHFLRSDPPFLTGRKALAVSLSDIAAMGGEPRACLLSLALPPAAGRIEVDHLLDGFASAAREWSVAWAGGDIVASRAGVVLVVTVIGMRGRRVLLRSGAKPGDALYVTGPLGASSAGRSLLAKGFRVRNPGLHARRRWRSAGPLAAARRLLPLVQRRRPAARRKRAADLPRLVAAEILASHLDPSPRLSAGRFLAGSGLASAALDLSDGLSMDLARLCEASGTGAVIYEEALPISQSTRIWASRTGGDPFRAAVSGGEDYELLFAAPGRSWKALRRWPAGDGTGPILVGRVRPRREGIRLADTKGRLRPFRAGGYDAFFRHD